MLTSLQVKPKNTDLPMALADYEVSYNELSMKSTVMSNCQELMY